MKSSAVRIIGILGMIALLLPFCGCGDGGGSDPSPSVDVTGNWHGSSSAGISMTMNLHQDGANVTGTTDAGGETGDIVGTVDGHSFNFTIIWRVTGEGSAEATVDGNSMSGTFKEKEGSGTFTATRS